MRTPEAEIVAEFRTALWLRAYFPNYPARRGLRAAWWRFTDAYTRERGAVPVAEINKAIFSQVGSVWTPYA